MAYTAEQLVNDAYEALRLSNPQIPPSVIPRLITLVPSALRRLPIKVKDRFGSREAELYRKNYTVALTNGSGSLATHTDLTTEPMIPSEIVKVTHADAVTDENIEGRLQYAGSRSALSQGRSGEFGHYAIEDNILYTMFDGDTTALGSNAIVRAGTQPLIGNVKFSHESLLLECLLELAQGQEVENG
jgi:hypothetical protein